MAAPRTARRKQWVVPLLIVLVAAALVAALLLGKDDDEAPAADATPPADAPGADGPAAEVIEPDVQETLDTARREADDPLAVGDVDAPVALVVYSDYQCPYCAVWVADTQPTVMEYVEAGDVRLEWRDVNVFGEPSKNGAIAAYAAGLQGQFWAFHDGLMADGEKATARQLGDEQLLALADEIGLDTEQFEADLSDPELLEAVAANEQEGTDIGAFSTPSFLIGGRPVVGAQPTEVFVEAIEQALADQ